MYPESDLLLTRLWHTLCPLHSGVQHLLGRHKEDVIGSLLGIHHLELLHQEVHTPVHVLLTHLQWKADGSSQNKEIIKKDNIKEITAEKLWGTHILHVFRFRCGSVPAIIQDENVGLWKAFIYFVEEVFLLWGRKHEGRSEQFNFKLINSAEEKRNSNNPHTNRKHKGSLYSLFYLPVSQLNETKSLFKFDKRTIQYLPLKCGITLYTSPSNIIIAGFFFWSVHVVLDVTCHLSHTWLIPWWEIGTDFLFFFFF